MWIRRAPCYDHEFEKILYTILILRFGLWLADRLTVMRVFFFRYRLYATTSFQHAFSNFDGNWICISVCSVFTLLLCMHEACISHEKGRVNRDRSCRFEDWGRSKIFLSLMSFDSLWDETIFKQNLFTMQNDWDTAVCLHFD